MRRLEDELDKIAAEKLETATPKFWDEMRELTRQITPDSVKKMNGQGLNLTGEIYFRMQPFIEHGFNDRDIQGVLYQGVFGENPEISREEFRDIYLLIKKERYQHLIHFN